MSDKKKDDNLLKISLIGQNISIKNKKTCPLKILPLAEINYKNLDLLNKFISERGKIISNRITNVNLKKQKALSKAIKRARQLALISPIEKIESIIK